MIFTHDLSLCQAGGGFNFYSIIMYDLIVIRHSDVTESDLKEIIKIKTIAWPYAYEKQLKWLNENLNSSDLHLLLKKDDKLVAYLNLVNIELEINNQIIQSVGVGNVCSAEKQKGYGNELMNRTNRFIVKSKRPGLLFCKSELLKFYNKFDWIVLDNKKVSLNFDNEKIESMIFNSDQNIQKLIYNGKSF
jgi:predicted GNAT family N-acyltransferase